MRRITYRELDYIFRNCRPPGHVWYFIEYLRAGGLFIFKINYLGGNTMNMLSLANELGSNTYPGRGIVIGKTKDGKKAVTIVEIGYLLKMEKG